jgi:ribosome recycling factor
MTDKHIHDAEERMKKALEGTRRELATIRSGKASPALLDTVRVEAYGETVPINQVGSVSAPEPRLLVVQPWDKSLLKAISRGIQMADLGLNPTDDGAVVRIPIPTLTEERRRDMVKVVHGVAEEGRVAIRNIRRDVMHDLRELKKEGEAGEDDERRAEAALQKQTDDSIAEIDSLLKGKEEEILEV